MPRNNYELLHVSKFRLEQSISRKQKYKGFKIKYERYEEQNWARFEQVPVTQNICIESHLPPSEESLSIERDGDTQEYRSGLLQGDDIIPNLESDKLQSEAQAVEDSRLSSFTFQKFLLLEKICLTITSVSLFVNIMYSEPILKTHSNLQHLMLLNISFITVFLMTVTIIRYIYLTKLREDQKIIRYDSNIFYKMHRTGDLIPMLIELFLLSVHPNALCKDRYVEEFETYGQTVVMHDLNDLLALGLLIRCYLIIRIIINDTKFASPRTSRLCRIHLCEHNFMYSVKCILKEYPLRALLIAFLLLLFVFGHGLKLSEGPLKNGQKIDMDFTQYTNCFWCVIVTMGTIGYGDYYPKTTPGRLICVLTAVTGVILSSLLIVALSAYLMMTPNQSKAHICIKRLKLQKSLSDEATLAMISIVNLGRQIKTESQDQKIYFKEIFANLKKNTEKVKTKMRKIKSLIDNNNVHEEMVRHFSILKNNLKEIYHKQSSIMTQLQELQKLNIVLATHTNVSDVIEKKVFQVTK